MKYLVRQSDKQTDTQIDTQSDRYFMSDNNQMKVNSNKK